MKRVKLIGLIVIGLFLIGGVLGEECRLPTNYYYCNFQNAIWCVSCDLTDIGNGVVRKSLNTIYPQGGQPGTYTITLWGGQNIGKGPEIIKDGYRYYKKDLIYQTIPNPGCWDCTGEERNCDIYSICRESVCGDGLPVQGEECDDGDADNTDGCTDDCYSGRCRGDGSSGRWELTGKPPLPYRAGWLCWPDWVISSAMTGECVGDQRGYWQSPSSWGPIETVNVGEHCVAFYLPPGHEVVTEARRYDCIDTCLNYNHADCIANSKCEWVPGAGATVCGDNQIGIGETCDDGGEESGDGCSSSCIIEEGWECTGEPSVCTRIPCYFNSQIIMRLFQSNNSHAAIWNFTTYRKEICYDEIFDSFYGVGDSHECAGDTDRPSNLVLWLKNTNNSHAATPERGGPGTGYDVPVCYGDLGCYADRSGDCSSGYTPVVRLEQETNSHVAESSYTDYDVKICCKEGVRILVEDMYWENAYGEKISETSHGRRTYMVVNASLLTAGERVTFELWETEPLADTKVNETNYTINAGDAEAGEFSLEWFAKWFDDGPLQGDPEYYFKVVTKDNAYVSKVLNEGYGELEVAPTGDNMVPNVVITGPIDGQLYRVGQDISFTHASTDDDGDMVKVEWSFGGNVDVGGEEASSFELANINDEVVGEYTSVGYKVIILTVTDDDGDEGKDYVVIGVLD